MTTKTCGCSTESCGCCEGVQKLTPASIANRPGLPALSYRVGTHGAFFESMKARLSSLTLEAPGADGQTLEIFQPLGGLTSRDPGDPAIALLDSWAVVGDVLTFYQERIANEGYLRTATERRSVLELARLVGYTLRPGVAATVYFAYTLEDKQLDPVEIPIGARAQSIPGPDELPQSFETSENWITRSEWNNLQVRQHKPQKITLRNALGLETIYVAGANTNLKAGDLLLLVFGPHRAPSIARTVREAEGQFAQQRTAIHLHPVAPLTVTAALFLFHLVQRMNVLVSSESSGATRRAAERASELLADAFLHQSSDAASWADDILTSADGTIDPPVEAEIAQFAKDVADAAATLGELLPPVATSPDKFVKDLLKARKVQPANTFQLPRKLISSFQQGSDASPQLLLTFAPALRDTYYKAWENATVSVSKPPPNVIDPDAPLRGLFAFRVSAGLFRPSVPRETTIDKGVVTQSDWKLDGNEDKSALYLDQAQESILPGSYVLIQKNGEERLVRQVANVQTAPRTAYGISAKTTQLQFAEEWWDKDSLGTLQTTFVHAQSEALTLIEEPLLENVGGQEIELAGLFKELTSGRWVILSGERADIAGVSGVRASELHMISGLRHDYDPNLPDDKTHTTLILATKTAFNYKRETLIIFGNVVKATHGETRNETLGSGDGSQALQSFALKQPPLTFVPASTPEGLKSTLKVYVNDVQWHETDSIAGLGPKDRLFTTKTNDDAVTTVVFGNGKQGSRLPSGVENVKAVYRNGIGKGGNVRGEQISLLNTKPLGVKSVINPLPASGGADKESRDQARENAPLAVTALDRLVGLQDYADFVRTFAGIAKADARRLTNGRQQIVHVTIAGADDIPIDSTSDLYRNLLLALRKYGDEALPVRVEMRELIALVLSANVRLSPDYLWEPVALAVRTALLAAFGFDKRSLGQPALLCEVMSAIQIVEGVAYVDIDAFGGIPEKKTAITTDERGNVTRERRLLTLDELAQTAHDIVAPELIREKKPGLPARRVDAAVADFTEGSLHPAQLAIFTPAVPDTLILNQIP
jgi:predicted phage baseplate assembly protein